MDITEVRVKLVPPSSDKLRAFCSITIDNNFVIRDLKVIEGAKGAFVAMPSRKLTNRCSRCGGKNHHRATYCNDCGVRLPVEKTLRGMSGRPKLHADIAHPINSGCRDTIQRRVLDIYHEELNRAQEPDYKPMEFDDLDEGSLAESDLPDEAAEPLTVYGRDPDLESGAEGEEAGMREFHAEDGGERQRDRESEREGAPGRSSVREVRPHPRTGRRHGFRRDRRPGGQEAEPVDRKLDLSQRRIPQEAESSQRLSSSDSPPDRLRRDIPLEGSAQKKRSFSEEVGSEPEDNFGAGLFS